ncbi:unnamed protein product [Phytophthora lilii]|uniref:Unnamed protein product n=1 Tax=Phytophthora lilii TaxID=2077276 RepID=A0A9W6TEU3_9STRA|nr:unnamed protein product [Phytophthora lilii]
MSNTDGILSCETVRQHGALYLEACIALAGSCGLFRTVGNRAFASTTVLEAPASSQRHLGAAITRAILSATVFPAFVDTVTASCGLLCATGGGAHSSATVFEVLASGSNPLGAAFVRTSSAAVRNALVSRRNMHLTAGVLALPAANVITTFPAAHALLGRVWLLTYFTSAMR